MPSSDQGLPLENVGLRGAKQLSQPRRRLALTLPGPDWLNTASQCNMQCSESKNTLLQPSWETKSLNPTLTTNSILTSAQSTVSSKPPLTSNSLLDSAHSINSKLSLSSDLLCSPLISTTLRTSNIYLTPDAASLSVTSNVSLSPKCADTTLSSLPAANLNSITTKVANSSLLPRHAATSVTTLPSDVPGHLISSLSSKAEICHIPLMSSGSFVLPTNGQCCEIDLDKETISESSPQSHHNETPNVQFTLTHDDQQLELNLQEDRTMQENITFPKSQGQEVHPGETASSPAQIGRKSWASLFTPAADTASSSQESQQVIGKESNIQEVQNPEALLKQKKMALISAACCSLVNSPNFSDPTDLTRADIQSLCTEIAEMDPEFVLKVALYTRQELNIRSTANFFLALSAFLPACRPHLRRYLCPSVQLPSDWMEIPRFYQSLAGDGENLAPLPSCLRAALTLKFKDFSEYQLAKYNTRKHRGKHAPQKKQQKKARVCRTVRFPKTLRRLEPFLQQIQKEFDSPTTVASGKKTKDKFSMKSLIQRLHISKPANHVMSLLGCRYPKDLRSFSRSGLEGPWQSHLSGHRMKLKQPETWERELSQKGNTGPVWESLLDNRKVPFMALLRNLRNLIRAGISARHHKEVNSRLSSQSAVIKSRLFPFRFLSAYKVIDDLESDLKKNKDPFPSNGVLLQRIFHRKRKINPMSGCLRFNRFHLRACLTVPAVHQLLKVEKAALRKSRAIKLDEDVLRHYKKSLEEAIQISAKQNIPPIPGRTVILMCVTGSMYQNCHGAQQLTVCTDTDYAGRKQSPSLLEVGLLLGLMVRDASESAQLVLYTENTYVPANDTSGSIFQCVSNIKKQAQDILRIDSLPFEDKNPMSEYLSELIMKQTKVDTLLIFDNLPPNEEFQTVLKHYRRVVNAECLCVTVLPNGFKSETSFEQCNDVTLCGFTEQVLKYVSERGTSRLLDHVEKVNERFNVPEDPDRIKSNHITASSLTVSPKQRWRSVRVFISSTFRDMHSERDLLIGHVMPQLRLRAARHFLSVEEVDLRWGITEEETKNDRQLSLCLSEVLRSQIFIGILGERYGYVPKSYSVPHLPEYQWIREYPAGRSITELEAIQFLQNCNPNKPGLSNALFYFRNPEVLRDVPNHWLSDFAAESQEAEKQLLNFKNRMSKQPNVSSHHYSCKWGGESDGKPHMVALEDFGARVLEDIWQVIERDFIKDGSNASQDDEDELAQEGFQEWYERNSFARKKLVANVCTQILEKRKSSPAKGRLFLLVGEPSQGKTVFMAELVRELRMKNSSSVIYHFAGASTRAKEAETMLTSVCKQLSRRLQRKSVNLTSYRALLTEFQSLLLITSRCLKRSDTMTLLIDGADILCGHAGEITSDWIPTIIPQRVNLVLSVTEGSSLCCSLHKHKDVVLIPLGKLEPTERAELVRRKLAVYGKKLEESSFNNQMRLLMTKKGTRDPLYLTLACEELRTNAVYEKLSDDIQKLPVTLPALIQKRLLSLENEHGITNVTIALTAICISRKGLWERDLLRILSLLQQLRSVYTASWGEILAAATQAENLPMATFSLLLGELRSVLGLWNRNLTTEPRLHLSSSLLREAVEKRYFVKPEVVHAVHLLMAAHFWIVSSPEDPDSSPVLHAECLSELSHHLLCGMQLPTLGRLLVHLPFLRAHAMLGLLPHLCYVYSSYVSALSEISSLSTASWDQEEFHQWATEPTLKIFREFIERSLQILSRNPSLFYQLALNEPDCSPVCWQAQEILADWKDTEAQIMTAWNNKPDSINVCSSKSLDVPSIPGCVSLSSKGDMAAVGTSDGTLHILHSDSGEEIRLIHTGCDGISSCTFISNVSVCVGSYDGIIEVWNISDGCRILRVEGHKRQVTGCSVSADHRQLLTCSLDFQVKLWDTKRCSLLGSSSFSSPLNCVAFHPTSPLAAVGSWDGKISVIQLENWKTSAVLCCSSSVKTVSFSMGGNVVVAGSLDGWVSLWSWESQVLLSNFRAHSGSTLTANFLQHGEYLLTGGEDGKVNVSSGGLGKLHGQECVKDASSPALSLAVSPNRQLLAVGYHSDSVGVYAVSTGDRVCECSLVDVAVVSLLWLSDTILVTGSSDSLIRVWNTSSGESVCQLTLSKHQRPVLAMALSFQFLASASEDVTTCLWSVKSLLTAVDTVHPISVLRGHTGAVTCCAFSPDGKLLATGGQDRSVLCWDVTINPPVVVHTLLSCHRDWVTCCSWADSNKLVTSSGDGTACLWDMQHQEQIATFGGHQSAVSSAISMGERVITTGRDGCLKVWNLAGVEIASIPTHQNQINQSYAYWEPENSRDDADLVVYTAGSDATVLKWSPLQMEHIQTLYGHGGAVTSSAADFHSEVSVTAAQDGSVRLWKTPCRDEHLAGPHHKGAVSAVAWSPDGLLMISGGELGDVIVWKQQKAVLNMQCGELCISSIVFISQRSFCIVSNDLTISRWILLSCKGGGLRVKKAYSIELGSLVVAVALNSSQKLEVRTLSGKVLVMDTKTGSLQELDIDSVKPEEFQPPIEKLSPDNIITASHQDFGVCDSTGALWLPLKDSNKSAADKWKCTQIHSASVTCLHLLNDLVITASTDRSVKIWKCDPFRQVGVFNCEGAVTCLSCSPVTQGDKSLVECQIACGDQYGIVYLLTCFKA